MHIKDSHRVKSPENGDNRRGSGGGIDCKPAKTDDEVGGGNTDETRKASAPAPEWTVSQTKSIRVTGLVDKRDVQLVASELIDRDGISYVRADKLEIDELSNRQIGFALAVLEKHSGPIELERWSDDNPVVYRVEEGDGGC